MTAAVKNTIKWLRSYVDEDPHTDAARQAKKLADKLEHWQDKVQNRDISNDNKIGMYIHCGKCIESLPPDKSPREWAQLEAGWTKQGLQVWCKRHECNVVHIDFEGQCHPANTTRRESTCKHGRN